MTRGELGSNGTVDAREREAAAAAELIRRCRPVVVTVPHWQDRHPDHVAASQVLSDTVFCGGLRRFEVAGAAWRPEWVCYYFINDMAAPLFVIDVSAAYDRKRAALACYRSQFEPDGDDAVPTRLTAASFVQMIKVRDAYAGARISRAFAESVAMKETLVRPSLLKDWMTKPGTGEGGP